MDGQPGPDHLARGRLLYQQRRYDLAEQELRKAAAFDISGAEAPAMLAMVRVNAHRPGPALAAAREAIRRQPDDAYAHLALGYSFWASTRLEEANRAAREAVRLFPQYADAFILIGQLAEAEGRWVEAVANADEALTFDPFNVPASVLRGNGLLELGRAAEAIAGLNAALAHAPENADLHRLLGRGLLLNGREAEALPHLRESLRLEPRSEESRRLLVETLRSRHPPYRLLLKTTLAMGRPIRTAREGAVVSAIVIAVIAFWLGSIVWLSAPPWFPTPLVLFLVALLGHRLSTPLFDLLLHFDPRDRHLLTFQDRAAAIIAVSCLTATAVLAAAACFLHWVLVPFAAVTATLLPAILWLAAAEPPGRRRSIRLFVNSPAIVGLIVGLLLLALAIALGAHDAVGIAGVILSAVSGVVYLSGTFLLFVIDREAR